MDREQAVSSGGGVEGWQDGAKKKKNFGQGQQCGDCWGQERCGEVKEYFRGDKW